MYPLYVVGGVEDQLTALVWNYLPHITILNNPIYSSIFFEYLFPLQTNQPILWTFLSLFLRLFGVNSYNYFLVLTILLNFVFSFILFRKFSFSYIYTLIFVFSSFFWVHLGVHPALMQIWLLPLFFSVLFKEDFLASSYLKLILVLVLTIGISNYLGFIILAFYAIYTFSHILIYSGKLATLKKFTITTTSSLFIAFMFLYPFVKAVYASNSDTARASVVRNYSDFFTFSSRPWYYILPPVKNPILGNFTESVISNLADTNYFLADDYFPAEHSSNYFGLVFLLFLSLLIGFTLIKGARTDRRLVYMWTIIVLLLVAVTMPPFFTISDVKFFTPGQLVYEFFPIFRVTSRLSIVILLSLLYLLAELLDPIIKKVSKTSKNKIPLIILVHIVFVSIILETYIPPKITKIEEPPEIYVYLKNVDKNANFMVYPYSENKEALFWLFEHNKVLLNSRDNEDYNPQLPELTSKIPTYGGIKLLKEYEVDYLVVSKNKASDLQAIAFFNESKNLELVKETNMHLLFAVK